jgi:hypothetical protein
VWTGWIEGTIISEYLNAITVDNTVAFSCQNYYDGRFFAAPSELSI